MKAQWGTYWTSNTFFFSFLVHLDYEFIIHYYRGGIGISIHRGGTGYDTPWI